MKKTTREWVKKAEEDYVLAKHGRRSKVPVHGGVCFHCQQCAEKYLKGLMEELGLAVPKTHDLELLLVALVTHHSALRSLRRQQTSGGCRPGLGGCVRWRGGYCASANTRAGSSRQPRSVCPARFPRRWVWPSLRRQSVSGARARNDQPKQGLGALALRVAVTPTSLEPALQASSMPIPAFSSAPCVG
jgi:HEPN domain